MHFAIIGNYPEITLRELQSIQLHNLQKVGNQILVFDTNEAEKLNHIASIIKRGEILPFSEIEKLFTHCHCKEEPNIRRDNPVNKARVLGIADKNTGIQFKKKYKMKRFKQVDIIHTDMEVKNKGIELIKIKGEYGVVQGYQNIKLYEIIDFDKPARSMQIGMMPAKLTHTLINIGVSLPPSIKGAVRRTGNFRSKGNFKDNGPNSNIPKEEILIFDPFCGTGTTGLLANALGYHFIGSDIKPNLALKNAERREKQTIYPPVRRDIPKGREINLLFQFHEQDISKPLTKQFNILKDYQTVIITEGRLGPIIKQTTTPEQIKEYQRRVKNLYLQFIQTITNFFPKDQRPPMVFTIPIYFLPSEGGQGGSNTKQKEDSYVEHQISILASKLGRNIEFIDEIYKRENQKVGRKIIILK